MISNDDFDPTSIPIIKIEGPDSSFYNINTLIEHLRKGMCVVGVPPCVETLNSFLTGYAFAKANSGDSSALEYLSKLNVWVRQRYSVTSDQGWHQIIRFFSTDEKSGTLLFWKLYDEFLANQKSGSRKSPDP